MPRPDAPRSRFELHGEPPTHLSYPELGAAGVRHLVTTRHAGSLPPVTAPEGPFPPGAAAAALAALGVEGREISFLYQLHGTAILAADGRPPGLVGTGDALVTERARRPLAIFTADCLAVILADPARPLLAVAHVGWRGTVKGLLGRLVRTLAERHGADPAALLAAVSPSIGPCCYEVDEPVVGPLARAFPGAWERWVSPRGPGKWRLDLWQANADQLAEAGVAPGRILNPRLCTSCRRDLFFSYRAEGGGQRLATVAMLEGPRVAV